MQKETKIRVVTILLILVTTSLSCSFVSYNAGKGDGKREMFQDIAKCTLKDAYLNKCFIPCAENNDCLDKNGMSDY